jgi:glutamate carboxypeptidase
MHMPMAGEILGGIRRWVEIESHTADVEGVNRLMTCVAEGYVEASARVERIAGRDGRGDQWR